MEIASLNHTLPVLQSGTTGSPKGVMLSHDNVSIILLVMLSHDNVSIVLLVMLPHDYLSNISNSLLLIC